MKEQDRANPNLETIAPAGQPAPASERGSVTVPAPSSARRDRLILKGLHSTGGIGQVWIAHDPVLARDVALKELRFDRADSAASRVRFVREAQVTAQLQHPGVVPVYQFARDEENQQYYYTMRYVEGRTLADAIQAYHRQRRDDPQTAHSTELLRLLHAFLTICQTVAYAHARQVIHRDLKGENVILGEFGEVIVLDWGLAKRLDESSPEGGEGPAAAERPIPPPRPPLAAADSLTTLDGERLGTPAYMAPEQALGQVDRIDTRTDVYGLAAILYEILCGVPPFQGRSIVETLQHVIHTPPRPPRELVAEVPEQLQEICLRGLAKERELRPQSAAEMASEIQNWIGERAARKRTEQERERFFDMSLDLLAILDARGNFQQANAAWSDLLGWERSGLIGRNIRDVLQRDEHEQLGRHLERILAGGALRAIESRVLCQDGSPRWVLWNASLVPGEAAIYIVGRDITERKQTEQVFAQLLESAPDAMVVVNQTGQIVLVNSQLERVFGYAREELLGAPIEVLVPAQFRGRHPQHVARFVAAPQFRPMASGLPLQGQRKDGTTFPAEISLSPVQTEQGLLVSCAVRDVTERTRTAPPQTAGP